MNRDSCEMHWPYCRLASILLMTNLWLFLTDSLSLAEQTVE